MSDDSSVSDDTVILTTLSSSIRHDPWPEIFDIPKFPVDVEFRIRQANLAYLQDKMYLNVPRDFFSHCLFACCRYFQCSTE